MLDISHTSRIPLTIRFHLRLPPSNSAHEHLTIPAPDILTEPPFKLLSTASANHLITSDYIAGDGWYTTIANTYGQPLLVAFPTHIPECALHYTAFTRATHDTRPFPKDTQITGRVLIRMTTNSIPHEHLQLEGIARVQHKLEQGITAHVTFPATITPKPPPPPTTEGKWQTICHTINQNNRHLHFTTTIQGMCKLERSITADDIAQTPAHHRHSLAILADYIQQATSDELLGFLRCCTLTATPLPTQQRIISTYIGHYNSCLTPPSTHQTTPTTKRPYHLNDNVAVVRQLFDDNPFYRFNNIGPELSHNHLPATLLIPNTPIDTKASLLTFSKTSKQTSAPPTPQINSPLTKRCYKCFTETNDLCEHWEHGSHKANWGTCINCCTPTTRQSNNTRNQPSSKRPTGHKHMVPPPKSFPPPPPPETLRPCIICRVQFIHTPECGPNVSPSICYPCTMDTKRKRAPPTTRKPQPPRATKKITRSATVKSK
jgi:hypothetical protein